MNCEKQKNIVLRNKLQLQKAMSELKASELVYKNCVKKLKRKPTVAEMRAECRKQGLVYDTKTKKCRPSVAEMRAECRKQGLVYDTKTKKCRPSLRGKKAAAAKPKAVAKPKAAKPKTTASKPKAAKPKAAKPKTTASKPKTTASKPKAVAKPKTTASKPKAVAKPVKQVTKKGGRKGGGEGDRRPLCPIPNGYKWDGRLGKTGKDGETWKVIGPNSKNYACKIFNAKKSEKLIKKEILDQKKMGNSGVTPKVVWEGEKCFLMEMVNGPILNKYKIVKYTEKDVKELSEIAHALADAKIAYADGNVKMNVMYDLDKNRWVLIDFGMVYTDSNIRKKAKKKKITIEQEYLSNAFEIMLRVEAIIMRKLYNDMNFQYTPLGGGFLPKKSFPSLLHKINDAGLLDKSDLFDIYKTIREQKGKYYDESKMIGV